VSFINNLKDKDSSPSVNDSHDKSLVFVALEEEEADDLTDPSQHKLYYIISGLQADSLYKISMRMNNVFGFSNWTEPFYFETVAGE
jgi:hypothetical protein